MRIVLAVSLAALAAAPLLAQKPSADDPRERWRERGIAQCVAELGAAEGVTPDEREAICACAADRYLQGRPAGALPELADGGLRRTLGGLAFACTIEQAPERSSAVSRWLVAPPPAPMTAVPPPPVEEGGKPAETYDADDSSAIDFGRWFDGLSLPGRIADLPRWAWIALALAIFLLLRFLLRGRDRRDNLMGPPRSMTLGKVVPRRPGPPSGS